MDGYYNTFVGYLSGRSNTTGYQNTIIGTSAGYTNETGVSNTFVGQGAGYYATADANTLIGYQAGDNITSGSGNIIIGSNVDSSGATTDDYLAIGTGSAGNAIQGTIGSGNLSAQDVQKAFPELVTQREGSEYLEVNYTGLTPVLIDVVNNLGAEKELMQADLDNMRIVVTSLTRQIEDLQRCSGGTSSPLAVSAKDDTIPLSQRELLLIMILGFSLMSTMLMLAFVLGRRSGLR